MTDYAMFPEWRIDPAISLFVIMIVMKSTMEKENKFTIVLLIWWIPLRKIDSEF